MVEAAGFAGAYRDGSSCREDIGKPIASAESVMGVTLAVGARQPNSSRAAFGREWERRADTATGQPFFYNNSTSEGVWHVSSGEEVGSRPSLPAKLPPSSSAALANEWHGTPLWSYGARDAATCVDGGLFVGRTERERRGGIPPCPGAQPDGHGARRDQRGRAASSSPSSEQSSR